MALTLSLTRNCPEFTLDHFNGIWVGSGVGSFVGINVAVGEGSTVAVGISIVIGVLVGSANATRSGEVG